MIKNIEKGLGVADRQPDQGSAKRDPQGRPSRRRRAEALEGPAPEQDLRLVIEKDAEGADYVYRLVDRATGETVAERPRDEVANLAQDAGYKAGSVVDTKA